MKHTISYREMISNSKIVPVASFLRDFGTRVKILFIVKVKISELLNDHRGAPQLC